MTSVDTKASTTAQCPRTPPSPAWYRFCGIPRLRRCGSLWDQGRQSRCQVKHARSPGPSNERFSALWLNDCFILLTNLTIFESRKFRVKKIFVNLIADLRRQINQFTVKSSAIWIVAALPTDTVNKLDVPYDIVAFVCASYLFTVSIAFHVEAYFLRKRALSAEGSCADTSHKTFPFSKSIHNKIFQDFKRWMSAWRIKPQAFWCCATSDRSAYIVLFCHVWIICEGRLKLDDTFYLHWQAQQRFQPRWQHDFPSSKNCRNFQSRAPGLHGNTSNKRWNR